jgi:hypothetical protein
MGKIAKALKEQKPLDRGRPDVLASIYETLPENEKRDFLLAITDTGIEATVLARGLIACGVSDTLTNTDQELLAVAIRRLRKGNTRFAQFIASEVQS